MSPHCFVYMHVFHKPDKRQPRSGEWNDESTISPGRRNTAFYCPLLESISLNLWTLKKLSYPQYLSDVFYTHQIPKNKMNNIVQNLTIHLCVTYSLTKKNKEMAPDIFKFSRTFYTLNNLGLKLTPKYMFNVHFYISTKRSMFSNRPLFHKSRTNRVRKLLSPPVDQTVQLQWGSGV